MSLTMHRLLAIALCLVLATIPASQASSTISSGNRASISVASGSQATLTMASGSQASITIAEVA